jgi:hypothetical protein
VWEHNKHEFNLTNHIPYLICPYVDHDSHFDFLFLILDADQAVLHYEFMLNFGNEIILSFIVAKFPVPIRLMFVAAYRTRHTLHNDETVGVASYAAALGRQS